MTQLKFKKNQTFLRELLLPANDIFTFLNYFQVKYLIALKLIASIRSQMQDPMQITINFKTPNKCTYRAVSSVSNEKMTVEDIVQHIMINLIATSAIPKEFFLDPDFNKKTQGTDLKNGDQFYIQVDEAMLSQWLKPGAKSKEENNFMKQKDLEDTTQTKNRDQPTEKKPESEVEDFNQNLNTLQAEKQNDQTIDFPKEDHIKNLEQEHQLDDDNQNDKKSLLSNKNPVAVDMENSRIRSKKTLPPIISPQKKKTELPVQNNQSNSLNVIQQKEGALEDTCCRII